MWLKCPRGITPVLFRTHKLSHKAVSRRYSQKRGEVESPLLFPGAEQSCYATCSGSRQRLTPLQTTRGKWKAALPQLLLLLVGPVAEVSPWPSKRGVPLRSAGESHLPGGPLAAAAASCAHVPPAASTVLPSASGHTRTAAHPGGSACARPRGRWGARVPGRRCCVSR